VTVRPGGLSGEEQSALHRFGKQFSCGVAIDREIAVGAQEVRALAPIVKIDSLGPGDFPVEDPAQGVEGGRSDWSLAGGTESLRGVQD
jgi:hypothetical protein